jgi:hypothetical protein
MRALGLGHGHGEGSERAGVRMRTAAFSSARLLYSMYSGQQTMYSGDAQGGVGKSPRAERGA